MTQVEKWNSVIDYAKQKGYTRYDAHVTAIMDKVRYRSHFPTILDQPFLEIYFGEKWEEAGVALLKEHWAQGDTIGELYNQMQRIKDQK